MDKGFKTYKNRVQRWLIYFLTFNFLFFDKKNTFFDL